MTKTRMTHPRPATEQFGGPWGPYHNGLCGVQVKNFSTPSPWFLCSASALPPQKSLCLHWDVKMSWDTSLPSSQIAGIWINLCHQQKKKVPKSEDLSCLDFTELLSSVFTFHQIWKNFIHYFSKFFSASLSLLLRQKLHIKPPDIIP